MKLRSSVYESTLNPIYQISEMEGSGGFFVEVMLLIYIFCGFGVMCDKHLIPAIEKIKERYNISERLAGSTILALGSSISLIASNMNAVLLNKVDEIELGLTGILGAAIFELTIGLAIGCFLIKKNYRLSFSILARDLIIYLIVLVILYYYLEMKYITLNKSLFLVFLWIIYMVYLVLSSQDEEDDMMVIQIEDSANGTAYYDSSCDDSEIINNRSDSELGNNSNNQSKISYTPNNESHESSKLLHSELSKMIDHRNPQNYISIKDARRKKFIDHIEADTSFLEFLLKGMLKIFSKPWELLLSLLTPKSYDGMYLFIHFLVPFILIWNVSEIELFVLEKLLKRLNVSANFLGLTITAWGNNAPDMFNVASAMSKGMVDLAMNAAIASEIHNILIGLALPWLLYNLKMKKSLNFSSNNLYAFTLFFFCFFILSFIIFLKLNKLKLNWKFALYLIFLYLLFLIMIILISFPSIT